MNELSEIDFDMSADTSSVGFPADLLDIMSRLVVADEPFFSAAEEAVLSAPNAMSMRGGYNEVVTVRTADRALAPVGAARILARRAKALPAAEFSRSSKRHSSHVCLEPVWLRAFGRAGGGADSPLLLGFEIRVRRYEQGIRCR
jgi:hypothetical protein